MRRLLAVGRPEAELAEMSASMSELEVKAAVPAPGDCLGPTEFLDYDHPDIQKYLAEHVPNGLSEIEKAIRLYYLVRDGWRYNPYTVTASRETARASHILGVKQAYCIPKAALLAALARGVGIPSRLGFGDVHNHLSSQRLLDYLRSDIFAWHGFTELYLEGQWVRATPAFDSRLCRRFKVEPMEFDGRTDSLFQEFDSTGRKFMEYIRYRGVYADWPHEEMFRSLRELYPHLFEAGMPLGDLYDEA